MRFKVAESSDVHAPEGVTWGTFSIAAVLACGARSTSAGYILAWYVPEWAAFITKSRFHVRLNVGSVTVADSSDVHSPNEVPCGTFSIAAVLTCGIRSTSARFPLAWCALEWAALFTKSRFHVGINVGSVTVADSSDVHSPKEVPRGAFSIATVLACGVRMTSAGSPLAWCALIWAISCTKNGVHSRVYIILNFFPSVRVTKACDVHPSEDELHITRFSTLAIICTILQGMWSGSASCA